MKFEANIPSYLKTGSGSFPVGDKGASKRKKPTIFYEQATQGFEMSTTTEDTQTLYTLFPILSSTILSQSTLL